MIQANRKKGQDHEGLYSTYNDGEHRDPRKDNQPSIWEHKENPEDPSKRTIIIDQRRIK